MNIQQAYSAWAESYDTDRNLTRDLDQRVTREALGESHPGAILEIGCGTGKNTALLAEIGGRVCALDFSTGMIRRAQEKVRRPNVIFCAADLTQPWPCAAGWADLVTCNLVLEHIHDLGFIFAQAARALVSGGRLFVCELHPFRQYQGVQAHFRRAEETTRIPAYVHHISEYVGAAEGNGLALRSLREWWHDEDRDQPPRLASFMFEKQKS